ncbi:PRC-barrel domain-containing protein [Chryseolinea sp. T2]|uniref:PRC-barrel domain-containing protein n=1 Tax=Chryseolinea sp. T2 TaxID=3129255 RepID=UPI003077AEB4
MNTFEKENRTGENTTGGRPNAPVKFLTASSLIGDKVVNAAHEDLGKVKDIMLNLETSRIEYVVVEFGGFLGLGEKLFAFPMEAFAIDTREYALVLNKTKEELEKEPGFDKDHWPETNAHLSEGGWSFMGSNTGSEW